MKNPFDPTGKTNDEDMLEYLKGFAGKPPVPKEEDEVKKSLDALKHLQNKIKKV